MYKYSNIKELIYEFENSCTHRQKVKAAWLENDYIVLELDKSDIRLKFVIV